VAALDPQIDIGPDQIQPW